MLGYLNHCFRLEMYAFEIQNIQYLHYFQKLLFFAFPHICVFSCVFQNIPPHSQNTSAFFSFCVHPFLILVWLCQENVSFNYSINSVDYMSTAVFLHISFGFQILPEVFIKLIILQVIFIICYIFADCC